MYKCKKALYNIRGDRIGCERSNETNERTTDFNELSWLCMVSFSEDGAIDYNKILMEDISLFQISRGGLQ